MDSVQAAVMIFMLGLIFSQLHDITSALKDIAYELRKANMQREKFNKGGDKNDSSR